MRKILLLIITGACVCYVKAQNQNLPFSSTLKTSNLLFVSGQTGIDSKTLVLENTSFESEVREMMSNLQNHLASEGLVFDDLVSTVVYLKDMGRFADFNEIYRGYFKKRFPTRTCIAVVDLPGGASIEISGIAQLKTQKKKR